MIRSFVTMIVIVLTFSASAGEVKSAEPKIRGVDELVTIKFNGSNWGYTYELRGFYIGTGVVNVVPVTGAAFDVLGKLNKKSTYECLIKKSTFVSKMEGGHNGEEVGGTYFVVEINCD